MNEKMRRFVKGLIMERNSVVGSIPMAVMLAGKHTQEEQTPVAYLYNGVRLPALPEWDRAKYPYALIEYFDAGKAVTDGRLARLICSSEPIVTESIGWNSGYNLLGYVQYFGFANHDLLWKQIFDFDEPYPAINEWAKLSEERFDETTFVLAVLSIGYPTRWANHDVISADTGWVHIAASEPIPVYE